MSDGIGDDVDGHYIEFDSLYHFLYFWIGICVICVRRQERLNFAWTRDEGGNYADDKDECDVVDDGNWNLHCIQIPG